MSPRDPGAGAVPFLDLAALHADVAEDVAERWQGILETSSFVGGKQVAAFEDEWAAYCGRSFAVGTANGTDALALLLAGLGVGAGDEVVVPANTFIATAEAVSACGARPVFVDVDPESLLLTPALVSAALTPRTAAVVVVHLYGHVADVQGLLRVTRAAGVALVEDAAQAHGAQRDGRPAGAQADAAAFSFYPTKNLGAFGDAGAVVTDDRALGERVRSLANHGRRQGDANAHDVVGTNSRLDTLQAAVLSAKLVLLDTWVRRRQELARRYDRGLRGLDVVPVVAPDGSSSAYHLYVVRTTERDALREALAAHGIETGVHYPVPCHRQPAYEDLATPSLPVAERAAQEVLSLPLHPALTDRQVDHVCDVVAAWGSRP